MFGKTFYNLSEDLNVCIPAAVGKVAVSPDFSSLT